MLAIDSRAELDMLGITDLKVIACTKLKKESKSVPCFFQIGLPVFCKWSRVALSSDKMFIMLKGFCIVGLTGCLLSGLL